MVQRLSRIKQLIFRLLQLFEISWGAVRQKPSIVRHAICIAQVYCRRWIYCRRCLSLVYQKQIIYLVLFPAENAAGDHLFARRTVYHRGADRREFGDLSCESCKEYLARQLAGAHLPESACHRGKSY